MPEKSTGKTWHPFSPLRGEPPLVIKKARGAYLVTEDKRRIIDGVSSWWVNIHGHGCKWQAKALKKQVKKLDHIIYAGFEHRPAQKLAHEILELNPANHVKAFYSDNGSTAVEVAIKLAIQSFANSGAERYGIIALRNAYHGDTFGAMATGERSIFNRPFDKMLFDVHFIDAPSGENNQRVAEEFVSIVSKHQVAAFIFEPVLQGAGGMNPVDSTGLSQLVQLARENNVITIADEVMTAFYRTGTMFACGQLSQQPDVTCLAKALSGGILPLAMTTCNQKIVDAFDSDDRSRAFYHGHSYTANATSCALGLASLRRLHKKKMQKRIQQLCRQQLDFAQSLKSHRALNQVFAVGTILVLNIKTGESGGYLNSKRNFIYEYFLAQNILLRPLGNVLYFMPPYVIKEKQVKRVHRAISAFLNTL